MKDRSETIEQPKLVSPYRRRTLGDLLDVDYLRGVAFGGIAAVLLLGLVYYVLYHVSGGFRGEIGVTPALTATASETEAHTAWYFRDETVLVSAYAGAVDAAVADGERVAAGAYLLTAYEDAANAEITEKLRALDARIALLSASGIGESVTLSDTRALEARLAAIRENLYADLAAGAYAKACDSDELLTLLNRRTLIFSSRRDYSAQLSSLGAERDALAASLTGNRKKVYAPQTAYFYRTVDGAESLFGTEQLAALTPSGLDALTAAAASAAAPAGAVGKLAPSRKWYLAFEVSASALEGYALGELRDIVFPENGETLQMKLEYSCAEGTRGLLVYSSERQPDGFGTARCYRILLVKNTYTGLRVPQSAIRYLDGYTGVYARFGNTVLFRVADVLGTVNGYCYIDAATAPVYETVCDENGEEIEGALRYGALGLYDEVVTDGTGMYHGLIVD